MAETAFPQESVVGSSDADLREAEGRLGLPIPAPLRSFYRAVGGTRQILDSYHHFHGPPELPVDSAALLFFLKNQYFFGGGVLRGELATPAPPVAQASGPQGTWERKYKQL